MNLYTALRSLRDNKWLARLPNRALKVFFALLSRYNQQTCVAYPSVKTLSKDTGLHERTIHRAIKDLRAFGLVTVKPGRGHRSNDYQLTDPIPCLPQHLIIPRGARSQIHRMLRRASFGSGQRSAHNAPVDDPLGLTLVSPKGELVEVTPVSPEHCSSSGRPDLSPVTREVKYSLNWSKKYPSSIRTKDNTPTWMSSSSVIENSLRSFDRFRRLRRGFVARLLPSCR